VPKLAKVAVFFGIIQELNIKGKQLCEGHRILKPRLSFQSFQRLNNLSLKMNIHLHIASSCRMRAGLTFTVPPPPKVVLKKGLFFFLVLAKKICKNELFGLLVYECACPSIGFVTSRNFLNGFISGHSVNAVKIFQRWYKYFI
jgi:hypothetical protein